MSNREHSHNVTPIKLLKRTLFALIVLMVLTVYVARYTHVPWLPLANVIAMSIAIMKATLVIAIFMAVKYSSNLTKLFAIGGFVWLLLLGGILIDYLGRPWEPVPGWESGVEQELGVAAEHEPE